MTDGDLDPETFEEEKYVDYFPQLQQAYKAAFERMNDRYDSTLVHAIDQQVLAESEPHYDGSEFTVDLPADVTDRVRGAGVVVDDDRLSEVLDRYVEELKEELRQQFDAGGQ